MSKFKTPSHSLLSNLLTSLPGWEVTSHNQVVKGDCANELEKLSQYLLGHKAFHVIASHGMVDGVQKTEKIIHGESRLTWSNNLVQEPSSVACDESRKRLALDQSWNSHLVQTTLHLGHPCMEDVILQTLYFIFDSWNEFLKFVPSYSSHAVHRVQVHLLLKVLLGLTDQGQEFVHITEPESTWNNSFVSWKGLTRNTL